jgi:hypothetical protein
MNMKKSMLAIMMASIMLVTIGSVCCTVSADGYNKNGLGGNLTIIIRETRFLSDAINGKDVTVKSLAGQETQSIHYNSAEGRYEVSFDKVWGFFVAKARWEDIDLKMNPVVGIGGNGLFAGRSGPDGAPDGAVAYSTISPLDSPLIDFLTNLIKYLSG